MPNDEWKYKSGKTEIVIRAIGGLFFWHVTDDHPLADEYGDCSGKAHYGIDLDDAVTCATEELLPVGDPEFEAVPC
jgi:hypothetical protein